MRRAYAQIAVLDVRRHVLRSVHRRLEKSLIAQTAITAVPVDLIRVDGDDDEQFPHLLDLTHRP